MMMNFWGLMMACIAYQAKMLEKVKALLLNDMAECSTKRHDSINIGVYTSHVHNPNLFSRFLSLL